MRVQLTEDMARLKLERALASFFAKELALLQSGVREDSLAHQLAIHIGKQFEGLDVDAEYDKMHIDGIPHPKKYISPDGQERHAIPDIIVHRRQSMENWIAIEIKKLANVAGRDKDFVKLGAYKAQLGYRFAVFLEIGLKEEQPVWKVQFI